MTPWNSASTEGIGIGPLDKEHGDILAAIKELQAAVERTGGQSATTPLLRKLANETKTHFRSEEELMSSSKYPGALLHALKHQRLLEQLNAFLVRYTRETSSMDRHSLNFLRDWFEIHIQKDDLNFGLWLNEHGKR